MSGRKRTYVTIADDQLRQLRQAQSRLTDVRRDLPVVIDDVRAQVRAEFNQRMSALDERQRRFDATISGLGAQVRSVEQNAQRRLEDERHRIRAELGHGLGAVRNEVAARLDEQARAVEAALAAESAARHRDLAIVNDQIQTLDKTVRGDRERAEAVARQWLDGAEALRAVVETEHAHERFAPGRLARLAGMLADARGCAESALWQAAAGSAQLAHRELSELRALLMLREEEHLQLNAQAQEQLLILRANADANAALPLRDGKGSVGFVDYWTEGGNAEATSEIHRRLHAVEADELDGNELRAVLTEDIPVLATRLDELVEEATRAEIGSQVRASIADRVVDVLADNGYDVEIDGGYEGGDQRCGFLAKADHADGSRVVVTVAPMDDGRAELSVHSFDADTGDDETRRHRAEALRSQLSSEGLEMNPLEEAAGGPDDRVHDVASLVRPRAADGQVTTAVDHRRVPG